MAKSHSFYDLMRNTFFSDEKYIFFCKMRNDYRVMRLILVL